MQPAVMKKESYKMRSDRLFGVGMNKMQKYLNRLLIYVKYTYDIVDTHTYVFYVRQLCIGLCIICMCKLCPFVCI